MPQSKDQGTGRFIRDPAVWDILCGKTKECTVHEGTKRFRAIIESYRTAYSQALTKFDKMTVTLTIYDLLTKASSRFLKWNEGFGAWEELSVLAARDKVGHALRFANRANRRERPGQEKPLTLPVCTSPVSALPSEPMQPVTLNNAISLNAQADMLSLPPAAEAVPAQALNFQQQQASYSDPLSLQMMAATMKLATDTVALLDSVSRASSSESITSLDTEYTPPESEPTSHMDYLEPLEVGNMSVDHNPSLDDAFPWDASLEEVFA